MGNGTNLTETTPVQVSGLYSITALGGRAYHSLALREDGTVWTWGRNDNGELGIGTVISSNVPIQVGGLSKPVIQVSGGDFHTTALEADGTVWTWGWNRDGQLGDGTNTERHTPVKVVGLSQVIAFAARDHHNLAIKSDGSVWAWGWNINGQLGDNTTTDRKIPVQVLDLTSPLTPALWLYWPFVNR